MTDIHDDINHPPHYTVGPVEVIEITEHLDFLSGNIVKYVCRHEHKGEPIKDLKKARWYLDRLIAKREAEQAEPEGKPATVDHEALRYRYDVAMKPKPITRFLTNLY